MSNLVRNPEDLLSQRYSYIHIYSDPDGDYVAFSTDEELCEALGFVADGVLKVYVRARGMIVTV